MWVTWGGHRDRRNLCFWCDHVALGLQQGSISVSLSVPGPLRGCLWQCVCPLNGEDMASVSSPLLTSCPPILALPLISPSQRKNQLFQVTVAKATIL